VSLVWQIIRYTLAAACLIAAAIGVVVPFMPTYDFILLAIILVGLDSTVGKKLAVLVPKKIHKYLTRKAEPQTSGQPKK
jgi:uncharacterized protein YqgC (DUF456 family)